jgi:hypothetical protein
MCIVEKKFAGHIIKPKKDAARFEKIGEIPKWKKLVY